MTFKDLLAEAISLKASDLHLVTGIPPSVRINSDIQFTKHDKLSAQDIEQMLGEVFTPEQIRKFKETNEFNASFSIPGLSRFRVNAFFERGAPGVAIRIVSLNIRTLKDLGLPKIAETLARKPNGLVLITGPAGMGKTTTMTAMIDLLNRDDSRYRIITIEDPIEYLHTHKNSVIIQREVGTDTKTFAEALKQALRQDPNVICMGEMRDLETISTTLIAAETGHLVLATLHTPDAVQTIDRIVNSFPPFQQEQVRVQLASCLQGVISQRLLPRADGKGMVLAVEVLVANLAVRNIIRQNTAQLESVISTSAEDGMVNLDKSLRELYAKGIVTYDTAVSHAKHPMDFDEI